MHVPTLPGLLQTMHATFGQARLLGDAAHALPAVVTQTFENLEAFGPKSHVGRLSVGGLNSCRHSAPQRT